MRQAVDLPFLDNFKNQGYPICSYTWTLVTLLRGSYHKEIIRIMVKGLYIWVSISELFTIQCK